MKTVYFIRHAKSDWADASLPDSERPLNERGHRDAPAMAKLLKDKGLQPDALVSSPANRAHTTAAYFAQAFEMSVADIIIVEQMYEATTQIILEVVRDASNEWNTILLFGHNPTFTNIVNEFLGRGIDNIPTCGVACVEDTVTNWKEFGSSAARLTAFYYPKQFI